MSVDSQLRRSAEDFTDEPPKEVLARVRTAARCHACGDGAVVAVCSRCARLLCLKHDAVAGRIGPRALLRLFRAHPEDEPAASAGARGDVDRSGAHAEDSRRTSRETATASAGDGKEVGGGDEKPQEGRKPKGKDKRTTGLAQRRGKQADAYDDASDGRRRQRPRGATQRHYCTNCVPRARPFDAELIAAATTSGLGSFVLPVQPVVGGLLVGVGALRFGIRTALGVHRRFSHSAGHSADLVLNPNLRKVKTRERIRGDVTLSDNRKYEAKVKDVAGSVRIEGNWSRIHRSEIDRYRRRTKSDPTTVAAGHLVLLGPARVEFRPVSDAAANGGPALVLEPRVADQEALRTADGHGDTRWRPEFRYDISPPDEGWTLPVWLSPNIAADLERHVLELHVQWCTRGPESTDTGVPLRSIMTLELNVPAHWGTVEHMTQHGDDILIGPPVPDEVTGVGRRRLTWKKIAFPKGTDRGSLRFAVRFSDVIDLDDELTGRLEVRFRGAVSGVTRVGVYRTDGGLVSRLDGTRQPMTIVDVNYKLSLKGLRYQQQRTVPDRSRADDFDRHETETFPGVVPDHRTVALLTNSLADEGYYVIRVLENPAQPGQRAGAINRLWDLAGRYYEGVYPIDFHLVISGEEIDKGQDISGETLVLLTVHGSYANDVMEQRVVEEWARLWKRIHLSLQAAGGAPRSAAQPLDAPSIELARLRNIMVTETERLSAAAEAGQMDRQLSADIVARLTREFGIEGSDDVGMR